MKLTKVQIQYIENLLTKKGIKYWDLRIEMIDHIVSDIELRATTQNFEKELQAAFKRIGWNKNLAAVNRVGWQNVNKRYRTLFKNTFLGFFSSFKNLLVIGMLVILYFSFSETISFQIFTRVSLALFIAPILIIIGSLIWLFTKKFGKSVHINYGVFYFSFSFLMMNMIVQFMRYTSEENQKIIWLVMLPIYLTATYAGYQVFKIAIKKIQKIKKELV
ncbi:hypothetical protein [Tenacibaculum amylolyticum]|uniref:hypothetical protein n=1 Tax=Tenacibaculum amylolyticum TaxID=104269 RepID=UPI00389640C6